MRDCAAEARPADETAEAEQGQRSAFCKRAAPRAAKTGHRNQGWRGQRPRLRGTYPPAPRASDAFCGKLPLDKPLTRDLCTSGTIRTFLSMGVLGTMRTFLRMGVLGKTPPKRPNPRTTHLSQSTETTQTKTPALPTTGERGHLLDTTRLPYTAARNSGSPACGGAVRSVSD